MADVHSTETRSKNMSAIPASSTKPEVLIRSLLHNKGYRFRKNVRKLPGSPDIVLRRYKTCIFVNGCFWHSHENCDLFRLPKSNRQFWIEKLASNKERDRKNVRLLSENGWRVIIVWECALKGKFRLEHVEITRRISTLLTSQATEKKVFNIR